MIHVLVIPPIFRMPIGLTISMMAQSHIRTYIAYLLFRVHVNTCPARISFVLILNAAAS